MAKKRTGGGYETYLTKEQREHKSVCQFLDFYAPSKKIRWFHPMNEGKRTPYERYLWGVLGGKESVSDFIFFKRNKKYCGLAIELKATGTKLYKRNGECYFPEQEKFLNDIREEGWKAEFAVGYDEAVKIIKQYFEL